jgi:hypothetical protein
MFKKLFLLALLFISTGVYALDAVTLNVAQIKTQGWQLHGASIGLTEIGKVPKLQLAIQKLALPPPLSDLKFLQVQCPQFIFGNGEIHCQQGHAELQSKSLQSPSLKFSFHITDKQSQFQIQQLKLFSGNVDIQGSLKNKAWQVQLNGKNITLNVLQQLLFPELKLTSGQLDIQGHINGTGKDLTTLTLQTQSRDLSLQTADGTKAGEKLDLTLKLNAKQAKANVWLWESENLFQKGSLYFEPLLLESQEKPLSLKGHGYWNAASQQIELNSAQFQHPEIGTLKAHGVMGASPKFAITQGSIYLSIPRLETAAPVYLEPFAATTALEGLSFNGKLEAGVKWQQQKLSEAYLISPKLKITDKKQRVNLNDSVLALNWADNAEFNKLSVLAWQQLQTLGIPLQSSYFPLLFKQQTARLLRETNISLLQGQIKINEFDWRNVENQSPHVHFAGQIQRISLEQLSQALNWKKTLVGNISGDIPGVNFKEGKLTLDGGLKINVFGGDIAIDKLAVSGVMSDFPQMYGDIAINQLDLEQITQKFSFGGMQGRISGFVKNIYLENWKPVSFYAWLGTPEGDDSPHKISQKAVENIASIGGGGVVDLFSRAVLKLFDNFEYDELGFGCYLYGNVCQMMGVAPAEHGYYIVKGGGLPRIDVMGYNTRIDWPVLQERLDRIVKSSSASSEAVVQ